MTQRLTPKGRQGEVLLREREGQEVYRKLHVEVVEKALPELERLAEWRVRSAKKADFIFF